MKRPLAVGDVVTINGTEVTGVVIDIRYVVAATVDDEYLESELPLLGEYPQEALCMLGED